MQHVAIIMGGYSSEYQISLKSGQVVYDTLDRNKYKPYRIHIFKSKWVYVDENNIEIPINKDDFSVVVNDKKIVFDVVFNAIHGAPGEDGQMQAYFKLIGLQQNSCDMYQAALTFNKRDCLSVLKAYGIQTANSFYVNKGDVIQTEKIIDAVGLPCFVKANRAGSSYGVSKVYKEEELDAAIQVAFKEDDEIIIEEFLDGVEVSVGVITYQGKTKVLPITEIVSENDFFDYEAKYEGKSQEITPARISEKDAKLVSDLAEKIYKTLNLKGFSRSEFIFKNGTPHLLEINTVPGLTKESILPQQAAKAGISLAELFEESLKLI
jgi:D-alanine-D-alanine ligase